MESITSSDRTMHTEMVSADKDAIILPQISDEKTINRNKPWRIVIRRIISNGRSDYENIFGEDRSNQSM